MIGLLLLISAFQNDTLTTSPQQLDEVVVVSRGQSGKRSAKGQVATIDEHLRELNHVELVRRGAYAWEPVVNNMQTERLSTTIDGMKIFYACTDKMDPVTSYVESGNLQSITLNSGLNGNPQATGNIGGALDLKLRKAGFLYNNTIGGRHELNATVGYETNGNVQVYGADGAYSSQWFYVNSGASWRHAGNYRAGNGKTVSFSQFQKINAFLNSGYRVAANDAVEATFIYDRAADVGYPALNMDVAKAEAFITSLAHKHLFHENWLQAWEAKVYYNHITHIMDDTQRPDVAIHMDMPGKSWTAGFYSLLTANLARNEVQFNIDGYYNRLFADMTMYPGGAAPMYMVTWPEVGTLNVGAALSDNITLTDRSSLRLSGKLSWQQQRLLAAEGYHALSVFFPDMLQQYHQTTGRIAACYHYSTFNFQHSTGIGWGSRAPTVTEAYGYYLNNTFDQYDYIGNPRLKNESAIELNTSSQWSILNAQLSLGFDASVFFFSNYIIGLIPNNVVKPFLEGNVLSLLLLAAALGFGLSRMPESDNKATVLRLLSGLQELLFMLIRGLIWTLPVGIVAFAAQLSAQLSAGVVADSLGKYVAVVLGGNLVQFFLVLPLFLLLRGLNPVRVFSKMYPATLMALFSKSSAATLPVTMQCAEQRLQVDQNISRFVLPICTTINMNGCAAFILVTSLFVMQQGGMPLTWTTMLSWLLISVVSAVGNAGVPMGCYFLTLSLMSGIGAPIAVLGIILPIYTIIDMVETAVNVWSDSCVAAMVHHDLNGRHIYPTET